jgi:hypothetical protein
MGSGRGEGGFSFMISRPRRLNESNSPGYRSSRMPTENSRPRSSTTNSKACFGDGIRSSGLKPRDPRVAAALTSAFLDLLKSSYAVNLRGRTRWVVKRFGALPDEGLKSYTSQNIGRWGAISEGIDVRMSLLMTRITPVKSACTKFRESVYLWPRP